MRQAVVNLQESLIRQVANAGMGQRDVLAFWFGESDETTPAFIREAAAESLGRGETFYSSNLGLPELREAVASYASGLRCAGAAAIGVERIAITSGGVNALMLAVQALVNSGDRVVVLTPVWPNLMAQPAILGGDVHCVSLQPQPSGLWQLDMPTLLEAITPQTRLLILNAPNNPTGWTLSRAEQQAILAHCRHTGTWILADEVYERLYFAPSPNGCAPSFLDIAAPEDKLVVAQSFSKSFLMTGWRLGWLVLPPPMLPHMGKLIEFNTSCAPVFIQQAGIAAVRRSAEVTPAVVEHLRLCRDTLIPLLQALPGVQVAASDGGMYAFFRLQHHCANTVKAAGGAPLDSLGLAQRLVREAGLGLAPGDAFMPEPVPAPAQVWLRWCFASRDLGRLHEGAKRLERWLTL